MKILVTMRVGTNYHGQEADVLESGYLRCLETVFPQAVVVPVPNDPDNAHRLFRAISPDLVVLTGGNDVPQSCVAKGEDTAAFDLVPGRDEVEEVLFHSATEESVPILGICRGMQFINCLLGGTVQTGLSSHRPGVAHSILVEAKEYMVGSHHYHGIYAQNLASPLKPVAVCADGIHTLVEAFSGTIKASRILGIQWHPEREHGNVPLFKHLVHEWLGL